jgi:hypothetical protein
MPETLYDLLDVIERSLTDSIIDLHHCVDDNRAHLEKLVVEARGHIKAARTLMKQAECDTVHG